jgi:hypothetical protein
MGQGEGRAGSLLAGASKEWVAGLDAGCRLRGLVARLVSSSVDRQV